MRRVRILVAAIVLVGLTAPLAHSSMVTAHLVLEAAHAQEHAADVDALVHTHRHEGATPSHQHTTLTPQPVARLLRESATLASHPVDLLYATASASLLPNDSSARGLSPLASPDLLPPSVLSSILRV